MTIRARLTAWYAGVLLASLLVLFAGLYYELVLERNNDLAEGRAREPVETEIQEILTYYAIPSVIMTLVGGWWLMKRALQPISHLTIIAEQISAQNLGQRLPRTFNNDELDRLTEVFNKVMDRLEASFAREREFTLHASHELKTPLTILRGQIETSLGNPALAPTQRDQLADHLDEIQRLACIVDELALLANADAGQIQLQMAPVRFNDLVADTTADAQLLGETTKITVSLHDEAPCHILGDRHRLRQLLITLADNALKYCPEHGRIQIRLRPNNGMALLEISNTGPGIPESQLPKVFDRFFRSDPAHGTRIEGSGLGLAIAKWITQAHAGTIEIRSIPHLETTISVQLPLAAPKETADRETEAPHQGAPLISR